MEKKIIEKLYNLILEQDITDEERSILIHCNHLINDHTSHERIILELSENIRLLAVKNISSGKTLSPKLAEFYQEIATYGEHRKNIGRGLISLGIMMR